MLLELRQIGRHSGNLLIRASRLEDKVRLGALVKIEVNVEQPRQQTFNLKLGAHAPLDPVFDAAFIECAGRSPLPQHRFVEVDDDRQSESFEIRAWLPSDGSSRSLMASTSPT